MAPCVILFGSNVEETLPTNGGVAVSTANAAAGTYYLRATTENAWGNTSSGGTTAADQIVIP